MNCTHWVEDILIVFPHLIKILCFSLFCSTNNLNISDIVVALVCIAKLNILIKMVKNKNLNGFPFTGCWVYHDKLSVMNRNGWWWRWKLIKCLNSSWVVLLVLLFPSPFEGYYLFNSNQFHFIYLLFWRNGKLGVVVIVVLIQLIKVFFFFLIN